MEWSAVRPNSPAREGSAGRALKLACVTLLCVAFVALSSHTVQPHHVARPSTLTRPVLQRALAEMDFPPVQVNRRDGLLQTVRPVAQVYAQPQMMRQQRAQEQLMQQQPPIVMGQVMPSLEEAPPAAPIAEPAAAAPLSVPVAPAAEVAPAGMPAAGMAPAIPGMAPPAGMEAPAAPGPMCPVEQQCQDTTGACLDGIGCLTQDATGAVMCSCGEGAPAEEAPQPPPPVPGSLEWMEEPENAIVAPGPEEAAAGSNLAMTESGNIAVNLNNYLHYKAQREQVCCAPNAISAGLPSFLPSPWNLP
jgi:hypothetical protein